MCGTGKKDKECLGILDFVKTNARGIHMYDLLTFLEAVQMAETGNLDDENHVRGDKGRSLGPLQIMHGYHADARVRGMYENVTRTDYARRTFLNYMLTYCPNALFTLDFQTMARIHNGGPNGAQKEATLPYWEKVKAFMEERQNERTT